MLPAPPPPAPPVPPPAPEPGATRPDGTGDGLPSSSRRRGWTPRRTAVVLAGTAVAGCAYVAIVDPNQSSLYPQCPFKAMTGWDCPGCGITRAIRALVTGHPLRALDHNVLFMVVLVAGMVWYATNWVRGRRDQPPLQVPRSRWWVGTAVVVVAAFWVLRNIPWGPFAWLGSGAAGV